MRNKSRTGLIYFGLTMIILLALLGLFDAYIGIPGSWRYWNGMQTIAVPTASLFILTAIVLFLIVSEIKSK